MVVFDLEKALAKANKNRRWAYFAVIDNLYRISVKENGDDDKFIPRFSKRLGKIVGHLKGMNASSLVRDHVNYFCSLDCNIFPSTSALWGRYCLSGGLGGIIPERRWGSGWRC